MPCTKFKSALELVFNVLQKAYWQKAIYSSGIRLNSRPAITKQRVDYESIMEIHMTVKQFSVIYQFST
jgi:hypothetical protein